MSAERVRTALSVPMAPAALLQAGMQEGARVWSRWKAGGDNGLRPQASRIGTGSDAAGSASGTGSPRKSKLLREARGSSL